VQEPASLSRLTGITAEVLSIKPFSFDSPLAARDWCCQHPSIVDLVIVREDLSGFNLLKELDAITPRPVYAVFLIADKITAADAQNWFYSLKGVFTMVQPLKAVLYPWFKHNIAMALIEAFPWHDPAKKRENQQKTNLDKTK
jgi:hypothetical protein